ncbi:Clp protease ClpP [Mycobacterium marinum]|nr:head maturation protease, ClpP-related [Mycobacterium marinum]MDC8982164.1 Clp protease ClpP [Mycobacterium marinum]MDC8998886.1 Clp protease ClpP [Mycobacterium marinum]MDC9009607.1 Clp protease ClpP [Mycobacterium marinum]
MVDEFIKTLESLTATHLVLRINSPGGFVFDGIAIFEALKRHPAHITAIVDGMAASAASYILQAADERVMGRYSELMIHDAHIAVVGNATEHDQAARQLDRMSDTIARIYADRAGGQVTTWREAMRAETWYSAAEAVAAGLADRIDNTTKAAASLVFDLSPFRYAGRTSAPQPGLGAPPTRPRILPAVARLDDRVRAVQVAAARRRRRTNLSTKGIR